jgi:iron complex outermembrane receptor protein
MNCIRKIVLVFIMTLLHLAIAYAGITDTIHSIKEIEVKASRLEQYFIGSAVQEIDSQILVNYEPCSLAELLSQQSLVTVKSYGPGGVAGISIRGGASHHSSVIWNGINIQSPMLGEVNLSSLPVNFLDKAYIQYGGATTLFGSGAATGSIHLSDDLKLNRGLHADISGYLGMNHPNFGIQNIGISNYFHSGKLSYSRNRWATSLKFFFQDNKNDFEYRSEKTDVEYEKLLHGSYNQFGIAQSNKFLVGKKSVFGTDLWLLNFYKEIPNQVSSYEPGRSNQTDRNLMYSVYYKYLGSTVQLKIQSGGFYNQVKYEDSLYIPPVTNNKSYSNIHIAEITSEVFRNIHLGFVIEYKNERALSDFYNNWKVRNIFSPVLSIKYENKRLATVISMRKEFVDGGFIPFVFSSAMDLELFSGISLKGQLSKNYTLPTFNNLYWAFDGFSKGNPDLRPEKGWSGEAGIHYILNTDNIQINSSSVVFMNTISNWNQWLPDSNGIWTPMNVKEGVSKGIEFDAFLKSRFNKIQLSLKTRYGYTSAIAKKSGNTSIESGKQMYYIPEHQGYVGFIISFKNYLLDYTHNFSGRRSYDDSGRFLPAYSIGNLILQAKIPLMNKMKFMVFTKINNIWNTDYQMKHSYAMPLRQYVLGIKFIFN